MAISGFPISGSPISGGAAPAGAPPPESIGPSHTFSEQEINFRHGSRYASEAANNKFIVTPHGVYLGFIPSFSNNILTFAPHPEFGVSLCRLTSQDDEFYVVDVFIDTDIILDFTGHFTFPVNVILRATGKLGFPHTAEIITQVGAPVFPTEMLLGVVTGENTIDITEPTNRDTPFAYSGTPFGYGFMKDGAVEELLASIVVNAEVVVARTDLTGFTHPDLSGRLDADGTASAMADRLGKENRTILADEFVVASPVSAINVSRAFSGFHRTITGNTPLVDFEGFGSETKAGAITSGTVPSGAAAGSLTDSERNVCAIIDATTEERLTDSARQVAYGRLGLSEITLTGTDLQFLIGSPTVTGFGTLFTAEISAGDIIQDPVNNIFYEVLSDPGVDTSLTLSVNAAASTPPLTAPGLRRRFTLNAHTRTGPDSETTFTIPASTVRIYFNAWQTVESAQYDYIAELSKGFEEVPIPSATTTALGKALVTSTLAEGKAGAIFAVQRGGGPVGSPHIHTIDFDGASNGGGGIADITQRGPTGVQGDPGSGGVPGPAGPQGVQGQGFTNFDNSNLFRLSAVFDHGVLGSGVQYSFSTTMGGSEILFLTGGNAEWFSPAVFDNDDHFQIDNIEIDPPGGMTVVLSARVPTGATPSAQVRFFLNAATR